MVPESLGFLKLCQIRLARLAYPGELTLKDILDETRAIPEPSGALALAGLKAYIQENGLQNSGKRFVARRVGRQHELWQTALCCRACRIG
jgi:hypothetical protein